MEHRLLTLQFSRVEPIVLSTSVHCVVSTNDVHAELQPYTSTTLSLLLNSAVNVALYTDRGLVGTAELEYPPEHQFKAWLTFDQGKIQVLFKGEVGKACPYLAALNVAKGQHEATNQVLEELKAEMGVMYNKVLGDSVRLRNPIRIKRGSQASGRRTPSGTRTPSGARTPCRSRGSQRQVEAPVLVASRHAVSLEDVSSRDFPVLVYAVLGLLGKQELLKIQLSEAEAVETLAATSEAVIQEQATKLIDEVQMNCDHLQQLEEFIQTSKVEIMEIIEAADQVEDRVHGEEEVKAGLEASLNVLSQKARSEVHGLTSLLSELKSLESIYTSLNTARESMCSSFIEEVAAFKTQLTEIAEDSLRLMHEKADTERSYQQSTATTDKLIQEVDQLKTNKQVLEAQTLLHSQRTEVLGKSQQVFKEVILANQRLELSEQQLRKGFYDRALIRTAATAQLQTETTHVEKQQREASQTLTDNTNLNEELQAAHAGVGLSKLRSLLSSHEQRAAASSSVTKEFNNSLKNLEGAMAEGEYFSDFMLKWTEAALQENRVYKQLQELRNERQHELQVMSRALLKVKEKFPVHRADPSDPLDVVLGKHLNHSDHTPLIPFIWQAPGVYLYGTRRVVIKHERGKLQVKVGGGFLPLDQFVDAYEGVERERVEVKTQEYSPTARKFMGKWAGGIIDDCERSPERMRESLVEALEAHARSQVMSVRVPRKS